MVLSVLIENAQNLLKLSERFFPEKGGQTKGFMP